MSDVFCNQRPVRFSQDDIDIELSGDSGEETASGSNAAGGAGTRREAQDPKQSLQLLLQRQAKFVESCREVKVRESVRWLLWEFPHE